MAEIYFSYHLIYSGQPVVGKGGKGEFLPHLLTQGPRMVELHHLECGQNNGRDI